MAQEKGCRSMKPLEAALALAGAGRRVFPIHWMASKAACSCKQGSTCTAKAKHPRLAEWQKKATTNAEQISEWWVKWPKANIGVACEDELVLDVDPRNGGDESLVRLRDQCGALPKTWQAKSGGGGQHFYFASDGARFKKNLDGYRGLDFQGKGRYIVAAPSSHYSGGRYEWVNAPDETELSTLPTALRDLLASAAGPSQNGTAPGLRTLTNLPIGERTLKALREGLPDSDGRPQREVAVGIARNLIEAGRTEEEVLLLMTSVLEHEASTLDPARPWTAENARQIVTSVVRGPAPDARDYQRPTRPSIAQRFNSIDLSESWDEDAEPEWVIKGLFLRGKYHEFVGPMGSGKSLALLGLIVKEAFPLGLRVAYLDEENGADEIRRRLKALGADPQDVSKYFVYLSDLSPTTAEADEAVALIARQNVDLAVFDSLADFYIASGLDEQSNKDATEWAQALPEPLAHDYGVATIGVDHTGHADTTRARGASAKGAKADATWQVEVEQGQEFDAETVGQIRLRRGRKNRQGVLPESHLLRIGGDGKGQTIFERLPDRQAEEEKKRAVAEAKAFKQAVLDILGAAGEPGLSQTKLIAALREDGQKGDQTRLVEKLREYSTGPGACIGFRQEGTRYTYSILAKRGRAR